MKKLIGLLFLLFTFTNVQAGLVKHIVFFGDSLTDNGNLYRLLFKKVPKSPYFQGHFSNGHTWAEHFGKYCYDKYYIDYEIYAYGGATAVFRISDKFISPATLESELNQYFTETLGTDKSDVLYAIWIGANDYLFSKVRDPNILPQQVVDQIKASMIRLIKSGAKYFLLLNLPDLSRTPYGTKSPLDDLQILTVLHNQKLNMIISEIQKTYPEVDIEFFNTYQLFNDVMKNPKKYNEKYHVNITNLTDACLDQNLLHINSHSLSDQINQALKVNKSDVMDNNEKVMKMSRYMVEMPEIAYTDSMSQSYLNGAVPCANADEHLFWDPLHPSAMVHRLLSQIILEQMRAIV